MRAQTPRDVSRMRWRVVTTKKRPGEAFIACGPKGNQTFIAKIYADCGGVPEEVAQDIVDGHNENLS